MSAAVTVGAVCEVAAFAAAAFLVGLTIKTYGHLSETVALSFDDDGSAGCECSRANLLFFPIVGVTLFALLTVVNPALGILPPAHGSQASSNALIGTVVLAAATVALAAMYRSLVAANIGGARRAAPFALAFAVAVLGMAVGMAFGMFGAHWHAPGDAWRQ